MLSRRLPQQQFRVTPSSSTMPKVQSHYDNMNCTRDVTRMPSRGRAAAGHPAKNPKERYWHWEKGRCKSGRHTTALGQTDGSRQKTGKWCSGPEYQRNEAGAPF